MNSSEFHSLRYRQYLGVVLGRLSNAVVAYETRRSQLARIAVPQVRLLSSRTDKGLGPPSASDRAAPLVPVRLELDAIKLRDFLLWKLADDDPVLVQNTVCQLLVDYCLIPASSHTHFPNVQIAKQLVDSISSQIAEFKVFWERWRAAQDALPKNISRLIIKLDLLFESNRLQIVDQFEWSLNDNLDSHIEPFACRYSQDLSLPNEISGAVAFCIREQLYLARRAFLAAGLDPSNDESLKGLLVFPAACNGLSLMRPLDKRESFTPYIQFLGEAAYERAEQSHERARRRFKRNNACVISTTVPFNENEIPKITIALNPSTNTAVSKRRRGTSDGWSLSGSPPRLHCMAIDKKFSESLISQETGESEESDIPPGARGRRCSSSIDQSPVGRRGSRGRRGRRPNTRRDP